MKESERVTIAAAVLSLAGLVVEIAGIAWIGVAAMLAARRLRADVRLVEWTTFEVARRQAEGEDPKKLDAWRAAELSRHGIMPDTMYGHEAYALRRVLAAIAGGEGGSFLGGGALVVVGAVLQGAGGVLQVVAVM